MAEVAQRINRLSYQKFTPRSHAEVTRFFDVLELLDPWVVRLEEWRPVSELEGRNRSAVWAGVAVKR